MYSEQAVSDRGPGGRGHLRARRDGGCAIERRFVGCGVVCHDGEAVDCYVARHVARTGDQRGAVFLDA